MNRLLALRLKALIAGVVVSAVCVPVVAEPMSGQGLSVRAGAGFHYQRYEAAWESASLWTYQLEGHGSRLDLLAEVGGAWWKASGSRAPSNVWQISATPFIRWSVDDTYYIEAGVGVNLFSKSLFSDINIGSNFQFGDHVGFGAYIGKNSRLGVRYSHYSNAGIKSPNPGLDVVQLLFSHQY